MTPPAPLNRPEWIAVPGGAIGSEWLGPEGGAASGCIIVPSVGHEELSMYRGLVRLARQLGDRHSVVMVQHWGTDQSDGSVGDDLLMLRWRTGVEAAIATMQARGVEHLTVVAARLGALIATSALPLAGVDRLVLWSPTSSGRRFVRELRIMQAARASGNSAGLNVGGYQYPDAMLEELTASGLAGRPLPAQEVLVIDHDERPVDPAYIAELRSLGAVITEQRCNDIGPWADRSIDDTEMPYGSIGLIDAWLSRPPSADLPSTAPRAQLHAPAPTSNAHHEQLGVVATSRLRAVRALPPGSHRPLGMLLYSTMGPGRSFVELARHETRRNRMSIRFDDASSRWSPIRPFPRPTYQSDRLDIDDLKQAIDELVDRGATATVLVGFCGGAMALLRNETTATARAVVAINPPLFDLAMNPDKPMRDRTKSNSRIVRRLSYAYRFVVWRLAAVRQLRSLASRGTRVLFLFDENDVGYLFWRNSLARSLRDQTIRREIVVMSHPGLGHNLEGADTDEVLGVISSFIAEVEAVDGQMIPTG